MYRAFAPIPFARGNVFASPGFDTTQTYSEAGPRNCADVSNDAA